MTRTHITLNRYNNQLQPSWCSFVMCPALPDRHCAALSVKAHSGSDVITTHLLRFLLILSNMHYFTFLLNVPNPLMDSLLCFSNQLLLLLPFRFPYFLMILLIVVSFLKHGRLPLYALSIKKAFILCHQTIVQYH